MEAHSDLKTRCSQVLKFMYLAPVSVEATTGKQLSERAALNLASASVIISGALL
jgi:hypothetical protein